MNNEDPLRGFRRDILIEDLDILYYIGEEVKPYMLRRIKKVNGKWIEEFSKEL